MSEIEYKKGISMDKSTIELPYLQEVKMTEKSSYFQVVYRVCTGAIRYKEFWRIWEAEKFLNSLNSTAK